MKTRARERILQATYQASMEVLKKREREEDEEDKLLEESIYRPILSIPLKITKLPLHQLTYSPPIFYAIFLFF